MAKSNPEIGLHYYLATLPFGVYSMSRKRRTQKKSSFNPWLAIVPAVLIIGGLIFFFSNRANAIEGVETFNFPPGQHRDGTIEYDRHPPAGGVHHPSWMNCGIYDTQVEVEKAVHSLEHGAVWIAYEPDLPADQVETLRDLVRGRRYTLLAPYMYVPLEAPIIAVAWGARLEVQDASDPRLGQFLQRYVNGPQTPEPGAACSGGVGRPIE
jgi:hypothetical protein